MMPSDRGAISAPLVIAGPEAPAPVRGTAHDRLRRIPDGAIAWEGGRLTFVGAASELGDADVERITDGFVMPGFVDSHTHVPFFGWRADEFEARLAGASYRDVHGRGGGIARSARLLAEASDEDVLAFSADLLREMLAHGTTAVGLKTGYGLSVQAELRQARIARELAEGAAQTCSVTLLAGHAVPEGVARDVWVARACDELIPRAAAEGLVDAVDVYVEDIAFDLGDLRKFADAADRAGLSLVVHADQLGPSGAAEAAVDLGARSADHLNHVGPEGVAALGRGSTIAGLCPASTFVLGADPPPVAQLVEAGAALGIATDCNPGTSPVCSMPETLAIACALYGLSPSAALTAATANPAWTLGLEADLGRLAPGLRADFLVVEGDDAHAIPYRPGHDPVVGTYVGGVRRGGR
jgi:imidazolonepropionase